MSTDLQVCEACQRDEAVRVIEISGDPLQPYRLCAACAERLLTCSLRPLEWFNLAAIHTAGEFYLHEDFYDENGVTLQSEQPVEHPERFPIPTLSDAMTDPERLIGYCLTRDGIPEEALRAVATFDPDAFLRALDRRVTHSADYAIEQVAYQLAARLGSHTAAWLRRRHAACHRHALSAWVEAAGKCLPSEEVFSLAVERLNDLPADDLANAAYRALGDLRTTRTLDWMEGRVGSPCSNTWGALAAVSGLSWPRAAAWLDQGRPLSLAALDALRYFGHHNTQELRLKLLEPAAIPEMNAKLQAYAAQDPVPRVQKAVRAIAASWDQILADY